VKRLSDKSNQPSHKEQIRRLMLDGKERTLQQISDVVHIPTQSVGARMRELRKDGYSVPKRRIPNLKSLVYLYLVIRKDEN